MADRPQRERDLHLPAIEKGGRWFTKYDPNIALDIVERIADGELLAKITAKDAVPITVTKQTFLRWVATVPELSSAYAAAIQLSAHAFEEKAIDKAQRTADAPGSPQNVSAASLLVSQYRWSAARRNPTRYSDKGNTSIVVPVNISTTLDMGNGRQSVEVEVPDIYTITFPSEGRSPEGETPIDGEFNEITHESEKSVEDTAPIGPSTPIKKEDFRAILRPDVPVTGVSHQPILQSGNKGGGQFGPRKRVLTPRIK